MNSTLLNTTYAMIDGKRHLVAALPGNFDLTPSAIVALVDEWVRRPGYNPLPPNLAFAIIEQHGGCIPLAVAEKPSRLRVCLDFIGRHWNAFFIGFCAGALTIAFSGRH